MIKAARRLHARKMTFSPVILHVPENMFYSRRRMPVVPSPFPLSGISDNALIVRNFSSVSAATATDRNFASSGISSSIHADFSIFKGKAALKVNPCMPKFTKKDSGAIIINKSGTVMLTFMPSTGTRKYDWEKRQMFALNPTEVGCLIGLGLGESCEFVHDPSMKSCLEGQVKKSLSVRPVSSDDGGYFISLTVNNNILKRSDRLSLPVSKAEFGVMRTSLSFILPYILGWDRIVKRESTTTPELVAPQSDFMPRNPHAEWSR